MRNRQTIIGIIVILFVIIIAIIKMTGQQTKSTFLSPKKPHFAAATLMSQPIPLKQHESAAQLLPIWRKYKDQKPTLLLLSNSPHLVELPSDVKPEVNLLVAGGTDQEIIIASDRQQASPLFLSSSAVDIAMHHEWFSRVAWALPIRNPAQELNLEKFRRQLVSNKMANETEAATFALTDRFFSGQIRNQQLTAAALPLHQNLPSPVVVHIDLSYFQPLYRDEASTPLLKIVDETLSTLKKMQLQTLAVTFSYGHLDDGIALDVRFLGDMIAYLLEDPSRLGQDIPLNWQRQSEALYQTTQFNKETIRDIYLNQEQDEPDAAWIKYNLYKSASSTDDNDQALDYLKQAVRLDRLYALEYIDLSALAEKSDNPIEALRLLNLAAESFPKNKLLKVQIARLTAATGDNKAALLKIEQLQKLSWSRLYYPNMQKDLQQLSDSLHN